VRETHPFWNWRRRCASQALLAQQEFPACAFGPVIGLNTAVCQFSFALAPLFLGIIRDVTGGYTAVLLVCIALDLGTAVVILGVRSANTSIV
jgi:hypothetical protein